MATNTWTKNNFNTNIDFTNEFALPLYVVLHCDLECGVIMYISDTKHRAENWIYLHPIKSPNSYQIEEWYINKDDKDV